MDAALGRKPQRGLYRAAHPSHSSTMTAPSRLPAITTAATAATTTAAAPTATLAVVATTTTAAASTTKVTTATTTVTATAAATTAVATTTATEATTTATEAAAATTATTALLTLLRFVDAKRPTVESATIHTLDRLGGFLGGTHGHEGKAAGAAGLTVRDQVDIADRSEFLERRTYALCIGVER
jgi:hypothetical protein